MIQGRRRLACYHEAGHALARWFFGFHTDWVEVLTVDQIRSGATITDRNGEEQACEGFCSGYGVRYDRSMGALTGERLQFYERQERRLVEIALIVAVAGIKAEVRFRKVSELVCYLGGGRSDYEEVRRLKEYFGDHEWEAEQRLANRRAAALVRSTRGWMVIKALAERLWCLGRVDGAEVDAMCSAAYGNLPTYDPWAASWPPTMEQIRFIATPIGKAA